MMNAPTLPAEAPSYPTSDATTAETTPPGSYYADTVPAPAGYGAQITIPRPDCRTFADVNAWLAGAAQ